MSNKILIADDSRAIAEILSRILQSEGYELFTAYDGNNALNVCFDVLPDLVLLDIQMPGKNGYEVCEIIKNNPRTRDIPVIFLSAMSESADKIKGLDIGAADYVTKPFDKGEVIARVKNQLKIRHLTRSLIDANAQLLDRQKELDEDLKAAAHIQQSLIPKTIPKVKNFEFAWQFIPCERIGGDIFNINRLDESHFAVYVVDVSGHGVTSAMITVSVSQSLLPDSGTIVKEGAEGIEIVPAAEVLRTLDREYPLERFDKYFTIAYLIINIRTGQIRFSSAGHPMPVLMRKAGEIDLLREGGPVIGMGGCVVFEEGEVWMREGDRLFLYTDGVLEYADESGRFYGEERFYKDLLKYQKEPLDIACEQVILSVMEHSHGIQAQDDLTFLGIERTGIN